MTATECAAPELVILVDDRNRQVGIAEKLRAHEQHLLHRAFSVLTFRRHGAKIELLLQQRALHKYHSPGLWTNTCCSHPRPGELVVAAGRRRLREELGISATLQDIGWFQYHARFPNGLSEHEIDHVLVGEIPPDSEVTPRPEEVQAIRWVETSDLEREFAAGPLEFTPWFPQAWAMAKQHYFAVK